MIPRTGRPQVPFLYFENMILPDKCSSECTYSFDHAKCLCLKIEVEAGESFNSECAQTTTWMCKHFHLEEGRTNAKCDTRGPQAEVAFYTQPNWFFISNTLYSILHVDHLVWWWCVLVHHIMLFNYTCVENGNVILPHFKNSRQSKDAWNNPKVHKGIEQQQ